MEMTLKQEMATLKKPEKESIIKEPNSEFLR